MATVYVFHNCVYYLQDWLLGACHVIDVLPHIFISLAIFAGDLQDSLKAPYFKCLLASARYQHSDPTLALPWFLCKTFPQQGRLQPSRRILERADSLELVPFI